MTNLNEQLSQIRNKLDEVSVRLDEIYEESGQTVCKMITLFSLFDALESSVGAKDD